MVGTPPYPPPWPDDDRLDPQLLAEGDSRNVVDKYRYWSMDAIRADLAQRSHPFHVAIENFQHDFNIGTVVRTANAFLASGVHIVGRRRWNRRGAMMTEQYLNVEHHDSVGTFVEWAHQHELSIVAVDNIDGATPIECTQLPVRAVLVFGQEGPGLSAELREAADMLVGITQFGSTRSINAGVAAGIVMHTWARQHATLSDGVM